MIMTNLSALDELDAELERATEGSRELDALIIVTLKDTIRTADDLIYLKRVEKSDQCAKGTYWRKSRSGLSLHTAPKLTESLDALDALRREVLPRWVVGHAAWSDGRSVFEIYKMTHEHTSTIGRHKDKCLAYLRAITAAMMKEQEMPDLALARAIVDKSWPVTVNSPALVLTAHNFIAEHEAGEVLKDVSGQWVPPDQFAKGIAPDPKDVRIAELEARLKRYEEPSYEAIEQAIEQIRSGTSYRIGFRAALASLAREG